MQDPEIQLGEVPRPEPHRLFAEASEANGVSPRRATSARSATSDDDAAIAQRKAQVAELVEMIEAGSVDPEDLGNMVDDLVYDAKASEGSSLKGEGLERELDYLLKVKSFDWLQDQVKEMIAECRRASR